MSEPQFPFAAPARPRIGFTGPYGIGYTPDEMLAYLKEKTDRTRRACGLVGEWLTRAFQVDAEPAALAVFDLLTLAIPETIDFVEHVKQSQPEAQEPAPIAIPVTRPDEELIRAQDQVNTIQERIETATRAADEMPEPVRAIWQVTLLPMLDSELKAAQAQRDYWQKILETQEKEPHA